MYDDLLKLARRAVPKGRTGLSTRQIIQRDRLVFRMAKRFGIPLVIIIASGYQNALDIARLNVCTVRAALHTFGELGR